ncbi:MAG: hypothetical protein ICV69_05710 [Thermoleophilaceae bacterium]|nr:hypothetical protein [Thermoleophilaceae bacterium]
MSERPRTTCPTCGEAIDPDESDVVEAVEVAPVPGFGAPGDTADGMSVVFHESCFPEGDPRYRRRTNG